MHRCQASNLADRAHVTLGARRPAAATAFGRAGLNAAEHWRMREEQVNLVVRRPVRM